jgi:hypothetical protein
VYPDSALPVWQLLIMVFVVTASLAVWLTAVFLAAREPCQSAHAPAVGALRDETLPDGQEPPLRQAA